MFAHKSASMQGLLHTNTGTDPKAYVNVHLLCLCHVQRFIKQYNALRA